MLHSLAGRAENAMQARILERLRDEGPLSRVQLAAMLDVSRTTIAAEVARLAELGLASEVGHAASRGGRRSTLVDLAGDIRFVGISIGATGLSVGVTDAFMHALTMNGSIALVQPHTGEEVARVPAAELFEAICEEAWRSGDPGLLFLDRIEQDNPVPALGPIEATNPCGEAPLRPFEACCLGGIDLARHVDPIARAVRWDELRETAALALRMMDDVIEASRQIHGG